MMLFCISQGLKEAPQRPSTSVPVIQRNETENAGRPKQEIHPPPPKDFSYADVPKKQRHRSVKTSAPIFAFLEPSDLSRIAGVSSILGWQLLQSNVNVQDNEGIHRASHVQFSLNIVL
jgi:hypothetical protein